MAATVIVTALVIFAAGAAAGIILLVSWGIHREERDFTLTRRAPGTMSQGTRLVTGLYVRQRSDAGPVPSGRHDMLV
ncbi:MAG TPA: hypothetical protein VMH35_17400 [Streptosporangiaceae bacterium]|nr:hypothetical protein [Streptosporangiaceae bacterium]